MGPLVEAALATVADLPATGELREPQRSYDSVSQSVRPSDPPDRLVAAEVARLRAAAFQARKRYPGPVGQLLAHDLESWADIGLRLDTTGLIRRVVAELLDEPAKEAA